MFAVHIHPNNRAPYASKIYHQVGWLSLSPEPVLYCPMSMHKDQDKVISHRIQHLILNSRQKLYEVSPLQIVAIHNN